ncbi:hypothetical protein [Achromobacter animicus]|uniref:hypothetical protein n=1 Tax=Achromobacter animicus TaxID=1389935 RepID=UPI00345E819E
MATYTHSPTKRFFEHLPPNGDLELTLLKCHLLVEEVLIALIESRFLKPERLELGTTPFSTKAMLARAAFPGEDDPWIWGAVNLLNKARVSLAHGLQVDKTANLINKFIEHVESAQHYPLGNPEGPGFGRFHWAAFEVFTHLVIVGGVAEPTRNLNRLAAALLAYPPLDTSKQPYVAPAP